MLYVPRVCCICADHFSASRARFYSFTTYTTRARACTSVIRTESCVLCFFVLVQWRASTWDTRRFRAYMYTRARADDSYSKAAYSTHMSHTPSHTWTAPPHGPKTNPKSYFSWRCALEHIYIYISLLCIGSAIRAFVWRIFSVHTCVRDARIIYEHSPVYIHILHTLI